MVVITDFSVLYYRMLFGCKKSIIENHNYFAHLLMNAILMNFKNFNIDRENPLVLAVDCNKKSNWRYKYYEENSVDFEEYNKPVRLEYKGGRVKDDELPWDKVYEILDDFLTTLKDHSDIIVCRHPRAEADDVIATAVKYYRSLNKSVGIVSTDKDFRQLLSNDVKLFNPIKRKEVENGDPNQLLLEYILTGQGRKDNILPIKRGIGPAKAKKMIPELKSLLKLDPELRARFNFNKNLIDLNFAPKDIQDDIIETLKEDQFNFNFKELLNFCNRYELHRIKEEVSNFKLIDNNPSPLY